MRTVNFLLLAFMMTMLLQAKQEELTIKLESLPDNTPNDAQIYLSGDINNWNPADPAYLLKKTKGNYQIKIELGTNENLEYKFTRGSWATVEKAANGAEITNRIWQKSDNDSIITIIIANWRDFVSEPAKGQHTLTGQVIALDNFYMPQLERNRSIRIYLPPDYDISKAHYPVFYMHDGQNLFDASTSFAGEWQVDETLENLYHQHVMNGIIVVGIYNHPTKRLDEYSPWYNQEYKSGGEGEKYVDFIVETLKPWIDSHYRTKTEADYTGIAGSSMGGLISLYAGARYPQVFTRLGIFSPAFWFAKAELQEYLVRYPLLKNSRVYIDVGTAEGRTPQQRSAYLNDAKEIYEFLGKSGLTENNIKLVIAKGAGHNEKAWAKRFPGAIFWLWESF